ncbi:XPG domain containing-domain-containing protein [Phyllosticta citrichinensis]|uniref:XPG domain containing-domain-containing protein n=1 Tax=Phyllosticta citrichinensis TaxID=1130410 RepID=A0ABR1XZR0_9PEZI
MGIPRLLLTLQDHGSGVELGTAPAAAAPGDALDLPQDRKRQVVIDGPGLAYYAYERAFAARSHGRNALEAMPSYGEVGAVAEDFLTVLERHGLALAAIFFDGLLPEAKRGTRISRLQSYTNQLARFRASNPDGLPMSRVTARPVDFGQYRSTPERLRGLPASPFLVPAVIDHLNGSRFSKHVSVVPAEADVFCADLVRSLSKSTDCWLVSNDSDLLIHDLGATGSVLRFPDISVSTLPGRSLLKGFAYCPSKIAKTLNLRSLQPFGFALQQDPHRSLQQCVRVAKTLDENDEAYGAFLKEFEPLPASYKVEQAAFEQLAPPAFEKGASQDTHAELASHLLKLDPRVSELIHQIGYPFTTASPPANPGPQSCHIYLPFLIEDPARASAWRISAPLRQLCYELLARFLPPSSQIVEFTRRGARVVGDAVDLANATPDELAQGEIAWESSMSTLKESIGTGGALTDNPTLFWKLFAVEYLCNELVAAGEQQQSPTRSEVLRLLRGPLRSDGRNGKEAVVSWDATHRAAQWHGVLYSLRMVRQILNLYLSAIEAHEQAKTALGLATRDVVSEIAAQTTSMPSASWMFDALESESLSALGAAIVIEDELAVAISQLPELAVEDEDQGVKGRGRKKKKKQKESRKRQRGSEVAEPSASQKRVLPLNQHTAGNRFGFLDALGEGNGSD